MGFQIGYPTKYTNISAGFPNYASGKYHGGIDFPCPTGTPVCAAEKGRVTTAKELNYSYGHYIIIDHGNGISTLYAHNSKLLVKVGTVVEKGQQIAESGSTGNSTGPHCHFEVRMNGTRVNPLNYLGKNAELPKDGNNIFSDNAPVSQQITYRKMKGNGKIISDYTDIYWYTDSSNKPKPWGFYGMKNEIINLIGKVDNYYYGWIHGICQSKILGLVPTKKIKLTTGKLLSGTSTFTIGADYSGTNTGSTGSLSSGEIINIPIGAGTFATREFSTEGYKNFNWAKGTGQRRVWQAWKDKGCPTVQGFAAIDGKILIACTSTFGKIGDNITWEFSNGDILDTIMGDEKSQKYTSYDHNPANKWGHNEGKCVLEFCGVPKGIKGYDNPYKYFGWDRVIKAANHGHYI